MARFTPLMKRPADVDSEQWLRRCVQAADSIDVPNKPEYLGSLAILGNLVYDSQMILDIISEETMQQPPIVEYVAPLAQELGAIKTTRKHILQVLTQRLLLSQVLIDGFERVGNRSSHRCKLSIDLKVVGTLRVPSALSFYGTRSVPTTLRTDLSGFQTRQIPHAYLALIHSNKRVYPQIGTYG